MRVVLGGGVSGLLVANKKGDSIVIEDQPRLGGVFSFDEVLGLKIPFHPPLITSLSDYFDLKLVNLRIFSKKENYLLSKLKVPELPKWLVFNEKMYFVTNLSEKIGYLSKSVKVIHSSVKKIIGNRVITNKGIITADEIYSTISRKFIEEMLGIRSGLKSVSMLELVSITQKKEREWDIYINGDNGVVFSHVLNAYWLDENYDVIYVIVPFLGAPPIWDKVYSDLKRERVLTKDEVIGFRSRIIKDAILIESEELESISNIRLCGRLGKWKNFTLIEAVLDSLNC